MADNMTQPQTVNTFSSLDSLFGTTPTPPIELPVTVVDESLPAVTDQGKPTESFPLESDLEDDYQRARASLRSLMDKGDHVIENMLQIALQTESARSFEVAGNLIKTMSEVAKDLVALHKQTNDAKKKTTVANETAQVVNNTQNNVVFQGTTNDLYRMMNK